MKDRGAHAALRCPDTDALRLLLRLQRCAEPALCRRSDERLHQGQRYDRPLHYQRRVCAGGRSLTRCCSAPLCCVPTGARLLCAALLRQLLNLEATPALAWQPVPRLLQPAAPAACLLCCCSRRCPGRSLSAAAAVPLAAPEAPVDSGARCHPCAASARPHASSYRSSDCHVAADCPPLDSAVRADGRREGAATQRATALHGRGYGHGHRRSMLR